MLPVGEYLGDNMTTYINNEDIERVKESIDIVDLVSDYLELKKSGANYVGLCPFHGEKTPSFTVSDSKQFYHCFGCGVSGDGISFIMKRENLDFPDAIRFLADKLGIQLEESQVDPEYLSEKERAYEINRDAARFFFNNLGQNKKALDYFKERQISAKLIRQFGLGYALDSWDKLYNHLLEKGHKAEEIEKLGLIGLKKGNNGYYDKFRNRVVFPIIDTRSRVIGFGGRVLDHQMPKYLNSQESIVFNKGYHLYGLNLLSKHSDRKKIILVEGYMDVIALFSKGITYSVASLGTALTEDQGKLLKRYGREIYICFDSDNAGIKASLKAIEILLKLDSKPKVILLPPGMDPDDYINKYGLLEFEKLMTKALSHMDYRILIMKRKYDLKNIEDKIRFTVEAARLIKSLKSPVEQDAYMDKISEETGISKEAIEKEVGSRRQQAYGRKPSSHIKNYSREREIQPVKTSIESGHLRAEIDLIKIILEDIGYFYMIRDKITVEDFSVEDLKKLYGIIQVEYKGDENLNPKDMKAIAVGQGLSEYIIQEVFVEKLDYKPTSLEEVLEDLANRIILNNLIKKRNQIINLIEKIDKNPEDGSIESKNIGDLFLKLTDINKEIKTISSE